MDDLKDEEAEELPDLEWLEELYKWVIFDSG